MIEALLSIDPKIAAVAGGVSSAILAACGYVAKIRYERKRTLRLTLFYLLQLHQFAVADELVATEIPERVLSAINKVAADHGLKLSDHDTKQILQTAKPILAAGAERQAAAQLQEIRTLLGKSLADLAKDKPILAYRLSGALPSAKLPGGEGEVRVSDFPVEANELVGEISRSIRAVLHSQSARLSKIAISRLIKIASLEVGVFAFLEASLIVRRHNKIKVPDDFFEEMAKPLAECVQRLVSTMEASLTPQELKAISESCPA